jgi:hypothetical protein
MTYEHSKWAEPLPEGCPPQEACLPYGEEYYRLVGAFPPSAEDFYPYRKLFPDKYFSAGECRAHSISLTTTREACLTLSLLPTLQNKKIIVKITLNTESGSVLKTSPTHVSWWQAFGFNMIDRCQQV